MDMDKKLKRQLDQAFFTACIMRHEFVTPEHLLKTFLSDYDTADFLMDSGIDIMELSSDVDDYILKNIPMVEAPKKKTKTMDYEPMMSVGLQDVLDNSFKQCASAQKELVEIKDVIVSMLDEKNLYCSYLLKKYGADRLSLIEKISDERFPVDYDPDDGFDPDMYPDSFPFGDLDDIDMLPEGGDGFSVSEKKYLEKYTVNLNEKAVSGEIDSLVGREDEIERTIQTLCRRTKNNPLHVGEPGVGKTAITEGLALKIVRGEVPDVLKDFTIYSLNMTGMIAGTRYRGEFEERMKKVCDEILKKERSILFIDEIHTIVGAGAVSEGCLDAASFLKPLLASGKIRCIGATTPDDYKKFFEKDRALVRRFQVIEISEPSRNEALKILQGLAPKYGGFHGVKYSKEVLGCALDLSMRLLPDRNLPDKAIDLIDEAGSYTKIHRSELGFGETKKTVPVSVDTVKKVASKIARVPVEDVDVGEGERLRVLEKNILSQIFGQDAAVSLVVSSVKKSRAGYRDTERPEAAFLFVGPTGVGKTELTKVLASELKENLVRIDMSEYQEKHTVSRLIGSPPGYVGFEEGGLLTSAVRMRPHSIILLDEIEKAHPDIFNILLQVMDYGTLTDAKGQKADFRNCIIIMTSNAGAREMGKGSVGFSSGIPSPKNDTATVMRAVEEAFSPEFRNRLDAVVPFSQLDQKIVCDIAKKELKKIAARLSAKKIRMTFSHRTVDFISEKGYSREFGARNIARTAENLVATPLVDEVLFGRLEHGGTVSVDVASESGEEKIVFAFPEKKSDGK